MPCELSRLIFCAALVALGLLWLAGRQRMLVKP
jgi:hypothetical protein